MPERKNVDCTNCRELCNALHELVKVIDGMLNENGEWYYYYHIDNDTTKSAKALLENHGYDI